jgi:cell wall-associated NlpC family hydrolase
MLGALVFLDSCHTSYKSSSSFKDPLLERFSKQLGTRVSNKKLYEFIDQWIGVPYNYGGKDRQGIDCSNFVFLCYQLVFQPIPYAPSQELAGKIQNKAKSDLQEGDLVFFKFSNNKVSHVGIFLCNNFFVHASTQKGVIISSLAESTYQKAYFSGGKYKY